MSEQSAAQAPIMYSLRGNGIQLLVASLEPGYGIKTEAGSMIYFQEGIQMSTKIEGGLVSGLKRKITGEGFFLTEFINQDPEGRRREIGLAANYPGQILGINLDSYGGEIICQKRSFLCSELTANVEPVITKNLGAGILGGEGIILQKIKGMGKAFIHVGGSLHDVILRSGEKLTVDTGCLVAFSTSINYDIELMPGMSNILFGKEGLFVATLTGPGRVFVQSSPFSRLIEHIVNSPHIRKEILQAVKESTRNVPGKNDHLEND